MRLTLSSCLAAAVMAAATPAAAQNLAINGSFETPAQPNRGYSDFLVGSGAIDGWTIVGVPRTYVSLVNSNYDQNPGFAFPAHDGSQWLDLAGYSDNAPNGVQQSIATDIGATYLLSFYLGNVTGGPGNVFGTQSSVGVEFGSGGTDFSCTNNVAGATLTWQLCSQQFVASAPSTLFTLRNLDPTSDFSNAVDDVSFTRIVTGVPEPTTWAMLIAGFAMIGAAMRRRRQGTAIAGA